MASTSGAAFYAEMLAIADSLLAEYGMVAALRDNSTGALRACTIAITTTRPGTLRPNSRTPPSGLSYSRPGLETSPIRPRIGKTSNW